MADWSKIETEGTVEDRRSMAPVVGGITLTGAVIYFLLSYLSGANVTDTINQLGNQVLSQQEQVQTAQQPINDTYPQFASKVLGSNDALWSTYLKKQGALYEKPKLVLFRGATQSACGGAQSAEGPHYCPEDRTIYLDETFFEELTSRFGAQGGDVAQAYVIAHEAGHHVQNQLGIMDQVETFRNEGYDANDLSVRTELQADCFAGVWAASVQEQHVIQPDEVNEAIDAAKAVGDDRIQKRETGSIDPESWTHGSSAQRTSWFKRGYASGNPAKCDTFSPTTL